MTNKVLWFGVCLFVTVAAQAGIVTLGTFNFNDQQFGNSLTESDGGAFRSEFWLNTVNADPGNPGALTGANFNSGIANVGFAGTTIDYTIGYNTPIVNNAGNDFALVAGFSALTDIFHIAVSTNGSTFTAFHDFAGSGATNTGISRNYFFNGSSDTITNLFVLPIDLTAFGIASGSSVVSIRLEGRAGEEPDFIRAAGMNASATGVPEPVTMSMVGLGLGGLALFRRRRS